MYHLLHIKVYFWSYDQELWSQILMILYFSSFNGKYLKFTKIEFFRFAKKVLNNSTHTGCIIVCE